MTDIADIGNKLVVVSERSKRSEQVCKRTRHRSGGVEVSENIEQEDIA